MSPLFIQKKSLFVPAVFEHLFAPGWAAAFAELGDFLGMGRKRRKRRRRKEARDLGIFSHCLHLQRRLKWCLDAAVLNVSYQKIFRIVKMEMWEVWIKVKWWGVDRGGWCDRQKEKVAPSSRHVLKW